LALLFFGGLMVRIVPLSVKLLLCILLLPLVLLVLPPALPTFAVQSLKNSFGAKKLFNASTNTPKITGVDAYMTTPDTAIPIFGGKSVAVVAVTNYSALPFAESGAYKLCAPFCEYHPYSTWESLAGGVGANHLTDINLAPNGWYQYKTTGQGNNVFKTEYCTGNGCFVIANPNIGTNTLKYAVSGGESVGIDDAPNFGPVSTAAFKYRNKPGNWFSACYTEILHNVNATVTQCAGNGWTITYP
jgi:hypothetical protein